ncbi:DUF1553 domain-containing protein [Brevifollis gellanilyticus]|uniref:Cytochrome c domain-containing protein n=1 Tax=Brevifollis gellanilyticus TaxID=748831 RepID=A0A512MAP2_9BACT|nr:DUF1553 domain-containing protein [Brevifollis gellanilyticus]GEP43806.1 hypothetical protein BGE01nite_30970 [Brevifollis gellanilyticus]
MNKTLLISASSLLGSAVLAATPQQVEFFESKIRPILAQECYECHSTATKQKGGLVLDSRAGWQAGGDSGDVLKPGNPAVSLLIQSIKHEHDDEDMKMPKNGAKLDDKVIADFEQWIRDGAVDPRDAPPSKEQVAKETDWNAVLQRRKQWWAFQPIAQPKASQSVDGLLDAELQKNGLTASAPADAETLRRRTAYVLTGLPPDKAGAQVSHEAYVNELLASPHFGEKWARHFMDWVRYAESYGSEGDPAIPYAYQYRDYLIRAFNEDVPYPQLVKEAIAGDLLAKPRVKNGLNESAIGIGQLRMVLHGFSPVDSLDEMVTFTDNQIDTVTKAFQGLTVSCARCHNHKFDAISQADFYAMYGIFTSTHPAVIDVNAPGTGKAEREELAKLKVQIKDAVAEHWLKTAKGNAADRADVKPPGLSKYEWISNGVNLTKAGEFAVALEGDRIVSQIYPAGYFSNVLTTKDRAVLFSKRFQCEGGTLWFRVAGNGGVKAKYVVQNYPRTGTIHKAVELKEARDEKLGWKSVDLAFWKGDEIFIQIMTSADMPAEFMDGARSWFGLTDVIITQDKTPPTTEERFVFSKPDAIKAWRDGTLTDAHAEGLNRLLQAGELENKLEVIPEVSGLVKRYREVEAKLPMPTRVPGVIEADAKDAALFVRGDHKQPAELVPRRFLDALDPAPFKTSGSGRLQLAEHMADMKVNPLTARVIVNRLWHHVFGRGIVATTDNFGKLGDVPTHPELLDFLSQHFIESGGSIKDLLKLMLTSKAFQRSAEASASSAQKDPENKLLSHWSIHRIEAESIRDSIISLSGKLNPALYGESVGNGDPRRSIYVKVIRNSLTPFLTTFDAPVPFATRGKRDVTNVPAQSLALLNDPRVIDWSRSWALRTINEDKDRADDLRIRQMFREAFAREANDEEVKQSLAYLDVLRAESDVQSRELAVEEKKLTDLNRRITAILAPVREKLFPGQASVTSALSAPSPLAEWTFDKDTSDVRGKLDLTFSGAARIEGGALVLDGKSMAESGALPKKLTAKTLEAWVLLDNLTQRGGGVMTVQERDGGLFDSIVFAEKTPQHWVAGSNFFERSELFDGTSETEAATRPVHVAVVYQADGTISGYRDGKPYGRTYRKAPGAVFEAGKSQILLGCRHGKPAGNKGLSGRIYRARLYDRALTAEEIEQTSRIEATTVSEADILAALSNEQRAALTSLQTQRDQVSQSLAAARDHLSDDNPQLQAWTSLAQSLINLKEFIYLR